MPAQLHAKPTHALPRERSRARGCKTASKKISSFSRSRTYARCAPAHTAPRETALFMGASISGALVLRFPGQYADSETGLFYNYFRTYDPRIRGGYIQPDPIGLDGGWNRTLYSNANPLSFTDPTGEIVFIPPAIVWGVPIVAGAWWAATRPPIAGPTYVKPPEHARDRDGPKAPGKPGEAEGFKDPKGGENWVRNPNGRGSGWQGADGGVWCPTGPDSGSTGDAHGGPHWDVQYPGGRYDNVYPGGRRR
jgi:RHS repeat-associated protein